MALRDVFARIGQAFRNGAQAGASKRAALRSPASSAAPAPAPARAPVGHRPQSAAAAQFFAVLENMNWQMQDMPAIGRWAAVSDAVRQAFPDRGVALLKEAGSWLDFPSLNRQERVCSLCQRSLAEPSTLTMVLCPHCALIRSEKDLPTEATFAEILRAVQSSGDERAEEMAREVERQWNANRLRAVESGVCAACSLSAGAVTGRMTLCFGCLAAERIPVAPVR